MDRRPAFDEAFGAVGLRDRQDDIKEGLVIVLQQEWYVPATPKGWFPVYYLFIRSGW